jgi:AcrR family transcriptional regulator
MMARTGRRPGATDTRGEILAAARRQFTANGYDGTTIRGIAADAGVDPALVHHYFGAKDELFIAALDFPANPANVIPSLVAQGLDGLGERMVRTIVTVWDSVDINPVLMLLRSMAAGELTTEPTHDFFKRTILRPLASALDMPDAELRATLAASQFTGLAMVRYVIRLEPLASASPEEVARLIGPNVQRYLTGDLQT